MTRVTFYPLCGRVLILIAGALLSGVASANDGGINVGGSPELLKDHPSVQMAGEDVRITVGRETLTADCRFVFQNHGAACTVRMGFPDRGTGAYDPDEEGPHNPPSGTFVSFQSWVNGAATPTRLIRAHQEGEYWHTKTVHFPSHSRVIVRDLYTQRVSGQISELEVMVTRVGYVLHTGASWHGPIGRSEISVHFLAPELQGKALRLISGDGMKVKDADWKHHPEWIYYVGPGRPSVSGQTVRFSRTAWRPAEKDDIELDCLLPALSSGITVRKPDPQG